ncbi:MAG: hypothetical protein HY062_04945 [Bacteroidetes bacterium]|nr:hypothetical protein [Bacteroidota bacterium]
MNDPKLLVLISKHISKEETLEEKKALNDWLSENDRNVQIFEKIKNTWLEIESKPTPFFKRFTKKYLTKVVIQKALGNLVGFAVAMLVSNSFTHYVTERRNIKNLFGLAGRKKIVVNDMPEWFQYGVSVLLGFFVLELINHIFETKKHILALNFIKDKIHKN